MREPVTKWDLESAFKALDEIEIPKVRGLKPSRGDVAEATKRVDKTSLLVEDYYDVRSQKDVADATAERSAEIAKAKLARIEKIVDMDAETEEDIQPTYVGKTIVQCPQCMTLFYRQPEDVVKSDEDETLVNVGERCPNCNYEGGFTIIGKVAAETAEERPEEPSFEEPAEAPTPEEPVEEAPAEEERPQEEPTEEAPAEESAEEEPKLEPVALEEPSEEPEDDDKSKKESLAEAADLSVKLKAHNEYIDYLQKQIEDCESEAASAKNEEVQAAIQRKIDLLKADLDAALPEAVKADVQTDELPAADEIPEEGEADEKTESLTEADANICKINKSITHTKGEIEDLNEAAEPTEAEINALFDSKEFQTPISDAEVRGYFRESKEDCHQKSVDAKRKFDEIVNARESFDACEIEDFDDESFNEAACDYFTDVYDNVESFETTECKSEGDGRLVVEGVIKFKSGKEKPTKFEFKKNRAGVFEGRNHDVAEGKAFALNERYDAERKRLVTESMSYNYYIGKAFVSGETGKKKK